MRGSVGYWGSSATGGLVIGFDQEMVRWLEAQGQGRKVVVSVEKNREVIVLPDKDGGGVALCGKSNGTPYRYVSSDKPCSLMVFADLPVFGLMEVDFRPEAGCLVASIPETDFELPWPQLHADCETYDPSALLKECLQVRLISLVASGLTTFPTQHRMPMSLRRLLPDGAWAECLATAKQLSGGLAQ